MHILLIRIEIKSKTVDRSDEAVLSGIHHRIIESVMRLDKSEKFNTIIGDCIIASLIASFINVRKTFMHVS